ncbi:MAG: exported protein of unknown function [Magnetococcales bacterium]|nr:exported protein of unknown function [Magnetococcales bacterium]
MAKSAPVVSNQAAVPTEVPSAPFIRLEAGMHTAMINRIDADMEGRLAVTVSDDKTARLWSLPDGKLLSTLRVPMGYGFEGALYATAMSPDGAYVLLTGETGVAFDGVYHVYIFDGTNGKPVGRLSGHKTLIRHMAYAPDGQRFAVAAGDGLFVYDNSGKRMGMDQEYEGAVNWVAFDANGRMATTSMDGYVRLYTPDAKLISKHRLPGQDRLHSIEFSPDNTLLAVGFRDKARVEVLSADPLNIKYSPETGGTGKGFFSSVAWMAKGTETVLVAGGSVTDSKGGSGILRSWDQGGRGSHRDHVISGHGTVMQIKAIPGGGAVYATTTSWGMIQTTGNQIQAVEKQHTPSINLRDIHSRRFALSDDGMVVEFSELGKKTYRFDLEASTLSSVTTPDGSLTKPILEKKPSLQVTDWANSSNPKLNGQPITIEEGEISRSMALAPDGKRFLLGSDFHLRLIDNKGQIIKEVEVPAAVAGIVVSNSGHLVVAALYDGTLRWYGLAKDNLLEELMAFFMDGNNPTRWIAWVPEGFFAHAAGAGKDLVGFHINKGRKKAPEWVVVGQLYKKLHNHSILVQKLSGRSEDKAAIQSEVKQNGDLTAFLQEGKLPEATPVEFCYTPSGKGTETCEAIPSVLAIKTRGRGRVVAGVTGEKPAGENIQTAGCRLDPSAPQTRGRSRDGDQEAAKGGDQALISCTVPEGMGQVKIRYKVVDRGGGLGKAAFFLNERSVDEHPVDAKGSGQAAALKPQENALKVEQVVQLQGEKSVVRARFYEKTNSSYGSVPPVEFRVATASRVEESAVKSRGAGDLVQEPRMIVLAAGIDRYNGKGGWGALNFAVKDALGTVNGFYERKGKIFSQFLTVDSSSASGDIVFTEYRKGNENANILMDEKVTKANLLKAFDALVATVNSPNDTVVIYLGGHGINQSDNFYFIPVDLGEGKIEQKGLGGNEILERIRDVNKKTGKLVLLFDTCFGGAMSLSKMENLSDEGGIFLIGAASSTQEALDEFPNSGHGLFTHTLLQGLDKAAPREETEVTPPSQRNLPKYKERMPANVRKHSQTAAFKAAGNTETFPIAEIKQ